MSVSHRWPLATLPVHRVLVRALGLGLLGGLAGALACKALRPSLPWTDALGIAQGLSLLVGLPALLAPLCARSSRPLLLLALCAWGAAWTLLPAGLVADELVRARWEGLGPLEAHGRLAERLLRFWRLGTREFGLLLAGPIPLLGLGLLRLAPRRAPAWAHLLVGAGTAHAAAVIMFHAGDGHVPVGVLGPVLLGGALAAAAAALAEDLAALVRRARGAPRARTGACPTFAWLLRAGWGPSPVARRAGVWALMWLAAGLGCWASWGQLSRRLAVLLGERLGTGDDDGQDGARLTWLVAEAPAARATALPVLEAALGDSRASRQFQALCVIGWLDGEAQVRPGLERLLRHPEKDVRYLALGALMRLSDPRSGPPLRAAWSAEPLEEHRLPLLVALFQVEGPGCVLELEWSGARAGEEQFALVRAWERAVESGDVPTLRRLLPVLWARLEEPRLGTWRAWTRRYCPSLEPEMETARRLREARPSSLTPAARTPGPPPR